MIKSCARLLVVILCLALGLAPAHAETQTPPRFKAVAFDYFTIFDPNSITPAVEKAFPGKGTEFVQKWRAKQFEYADLHAITDRYQDFFETTADALTYTATSMHLDLDDATKKQLLDAYLHLKPWPDAVENLKKLKAAGVQLVPLANFSIKMLQENATNAGIADLFDQMISTELNRTYKPSPRAYALALQKLNLKKTDILFAAFGGWDAYGAKDFGYTTYWVNRLNLPPEQLGNSPDATSKDLKGLVDFVLRGA